ncbi:hypothetical protein TNCV_4539541 [Trichonephila clavipes]|nr:hypothetical protein TNCV_4539541 [Trichonephila clavipes]
MWPLLKRRTGETLTPERMCGGNLTTGGVDRWTQTMIKFDRATHICIQARFQTSKKVAGKTKMPKIIFEGIHTPKEVIGGPETFKHLAVKVETRKPLGEMNEMLKEMSGVNSNSNTKVRDLC